MILHADFDAFFASVEQHKEPRLRGKPVVVGGQPDESSVIASCSYEARRFGLCAGMPLRQAKRLCPGAVFLTGSYPEYARTSKKVFSFLRDLSPTVEEVSLDEAYVDLSGAEHLHGGAWRAARALRRRAFEATGLSVSVGLGETRILARLATACAKPDGIGMLFEARRHLFMERLPLDELPGIGRKTLDLFQRLNLERAGDLARVPKDLLVKTVGGRGKALYKLARGEDPRPLDPGRRPRFVSRRSALHRPSADYGLLKGYLFYLCERTALGLREIGACAKRVKVLLEYDDYKSRDASVGVEATDLERTLYEAAEPLFRRLHDRRVKIRRVGVEAHQLAFTRAQQQLLVGRRFVQLARAVEQIRKRHGFHRIVQGPSLALLGELEQNEHGFVLRTASLTR